MHRNQDRSGFQRCQVFVRFIVSLLSASKLVNTLAFPVNYIYKICVVNILKKNNALIIVVILTAMLLIISVIVVFNKRIHNIEAKQQIR